MNQEADVSRSTLPAEELAAYAALGGIPTEDRPLTDTLQQVAQLAKQVLTGAPEVSVTLLQERHAHTAAYTGELALHLDERQYDTGSGPCVDAALTGQNIRLSMDDEPDGLYPDFRHVALRQGVTHSLSIAMPVTARAAGALNLYSSSGSVFGGSTERVATHFAGFAGIVLANMGHRQDAVALAGELQHAADSRAVIEQAKGILMAQKGCSPEQAFQLLVGLSQKQNRKLRVLAREVVDDAMR
jgi:hypothetical protein